MRKQKLVIGFLIFSLLAVYGSVPPIKIANAVDSIVDAKDTISTSAPNASSTHIFAFTTGTTTPASGYWRFAMPSFSNFVVGNINCGAGMTASTSGTTVDCVVSGAAQVPGVKTVRMSGIINPIAVNSYVITITNALANNTVKERVEVRIAIVEQVYMSARVSSNLTFTISGMLTGATVNGVTCDKDTIATSTPFGDLDMASTTVCQQLNVATNADDGYSVTVEQNQEMTSDAGSNINSFDNSQNLTGSTTPHAWTAPTAVLDAYNTYGHMGLTSDDLTLDPTLWSADPNPYGVGEGGEGDYAGLNNTAPIQVMFHDGPANYIEQNKGLAHVAYTAEISALQEAGDYESTLTYICTPTF